MYFERLANITLFPDPICKKNYLDQQVRCNRFCIFPTNETYSTSAVKSPVSNFIESNLLHTCSHYPFIGPTNEIRFLSEYSGLPQATPLLGLHPGARWPKKTSLLSDHHAQQYGRPFQFKSDKPWGPQLYCFLDILRLRNTPEKVKVVLCTQLRLRRGGCCWWGC